MASKGRKMTSRDVFRALGHRVRRCLLRDLIKSKEPLSRAGLVQQTEHPLSTVAYHLSVLRSCGTVNLVDESQVRGGAEHLYEATIDDDSTARRILDETEQEDEEAKATRRRRPTGKPRRRRRPL
jgi:DNA-binding transcriptional ArsR family regulator